MDAALAVVVRWYRHRCEEHSDDAAFLVATLTRAETYHLERLRAACVGHLLHHVAPMWCERDGLNPVGCCLNAADADSRSHESQELATLCATVEVRSISDLVNGARSRTKLFPLYAFVVAWCSAQREAIGPASGTDVVETYLLRLLPLLLPLDDALIRPPVYLQQVNNDARDRLPQKAYARLVEIMFEHTTKYRNIKPDVW